MRKSDIDIDNKSRLTNENNTPDTDEDESLYYEYTEDSNDNNESERERQPGRKPKSPFRIFLKTLTSPVEGWKELKRSKMKPDDFARGCFYPLLALMAACNFATYFWMPDLGLKSVLINAFSVFISYFLGFFVVMLLLCNAMPRDCRRQLDTDFARCFVMTALASLSLVQTFIECMPILEAVLVFLPLYTIYMIVKGVRLLRCPENRGTLLAISLSVLTIGIPMLLGWALQFITPQSAKL